MQGKVHHDAAAAAIPNKAAFYTAMRDTLKWHLPDKGSRLCTVVYMTKVRHGHLFCLKIGRYDPAQPRQHMIPTTCPRRKDIYLADIIRELRSALVQNGLNMGISDDKHLPDKTWALEVLGTIDPDHKFFRRDYEPPSRKAIPAQGLVDNFDGLYDHVALRPPKKSRKRIVNQMN
jgi:hypothetical protein